MEAHIKVVGLINIVFGILGLFIAGILFIVIAGGGIISGDPTAMTITSIVAVALSGIFSVFAIPEIIAGWGILKLKSWGRILGVIVAILDLINIPIGTIFGIYALWVLMNEETEQIFQQQRPGGIVVEKIQK
ncbi:hypothetical protein EH223_11910 [candidate division KSB1 bacterium]|nr:hypothetical protein [candidate division KSB1 bacterium]RQW02702.1 MAG: hypothetical protein EH223_11910 [candidate division KSB1 bacterium]